MPSYQDAQELFEELDRARYRYKELCDSDFDTRNRNHLLPEAQEAKLQNTAATAQLNETLAQLDAVIDAQKEYLSAAARNSTKQDKIQAIEREIKELQTSIKDRDKTLLEQQRSEREEQLDAARKNIDALKNQLGVTQKSIDVHKKLIAEEKEQLSNDPMGEHQKTREGYIAAYQKWMEERKQLEARMEGITDSVPSLQQGLREAERALEPFQQIEYLTEKKTELKQYIEPLDENKYNERQELLHRTLENLHAHALMPLKASIEAGLEALGFPAMDIIGKNKNDVLVWDQKTKSLIPFADKALNYIDGIHKRDAQNGPLARSMTYFYGKGMDSRWSQEIGDLHIYPKEDSIKPDIITFDMSRKNILRKDTTPPEPPMEPGRIYQILDKVARFFGGRNGTCKQYDAAYNRFVERVRAWEGPEGYAEHMEKRAEARAAEGSNASVSKTVKSPEILKALAVAHMKETQAKQAEKEPEATPKIKTKSKSKSVSKDV